MGILYGVHMVKLIAAWVRSLRMAYWSMVRPAAFAPASKLSDRMNSVRSAVVAVLCKEQGLLLPLLLLILHLLYSNRSARAKRTLAERNGSQRLSIQTGLLQQLLGHGQKTFGVVAATLMAQLHKRNTRLGARQQGQFTEIGGSLQGKNMCIHRAILV